jgi:hypothetical protein
MSNKTTTKAAGAGPRGAAAADPREFINTFGLNQPGGTVYVVLDTGNHAGSAPITICRPQVSRGRHLNPIPQTRR